MAAMSHIVSQRLYHQQLSNPSFHRPDEVVAWLGAVQAQDYLAAKWALGLRMQRNEGSVPADDGIEQAFTDGTILRTHVMRPTWHFVTPADIRWMLALTAPRVHVANASIYRQLELDEALAARSNTVIAKSLQGGKQLTREELGSALAQAGILAEGVRLGILVHRAELDAVVCSGPRRGKQFTYALLEERAPQARILARDEALAELIRRYFRGHGPATVHDFAWWSGLTVSEARAGLDMARFLLEHEVVDGQTYWFSADSPPAKELSQETYLLPNYDEYLVGYKERRAVFEAWRAKSLGPRGNILSSHTIVMDGRVVGTWKRTLGKSAVVMELYPFEALTAEEEQALKAAANRYGEFLGLTVVISYAFKYVV